MPKFVINLTAEEASAVTYALADKIKTSKLNLAYMEREKGQSLYPPESRRYIRDLIRILEHGKVAIDTGKFEE